MNLSLVSAPNLRRAVLAALVALYYGGFCWWPDGMRLLGIGHYGIWFLDTHALLAASDAHALGFEAYDSNPLDFFRQPHVYSSWWFGLHFLGLTRTDHVWLGALLGFLFLAVALLQVKVRSTGELLCAFATLTAPGVLLGFNRGNADLLVFIVLAATIPCLLSEYRLARWFSLATILFATGLKFYPVIAGLLLLESSRSRREILGQLALFGALLVALAFELATDVQRYAATEPAPRGLFTFGAALSAQLLSIPGWIALIAAFTLGVGASIFWWRKAPPWTVATERADYLRFLLGAALLTFCYFATVNYAYRRVFAIFMVPFLWSAWCSDGWPPWFRRLGRITGVLLLTSLWLDGIFCLAVNLSHSLPPNDLAIWTDRLMLAQQPLVAATRVGLLGFLVPFIRDALRALLTVPPREISPAG